MQAPGGVDQDNVEFALDALLDGSESDRGRIGSLCATHRFDTDPLTPCGQLFSRGSPEGVGCAEQHGPVLSDQHAAQLADSGGLAGAVDPDDQHHGGPAGGMAQVETTIHVRVDQLDQLTAQHRLGLRRIGDAFNAQILPQRGHQVRGGAHTQIGGDQGGFEVIPSVVIDPVTRQQIGKRPCQRIVAGSQSTTQTHQTGRRRLRLLISRFRRQRWQFPLRHLHRGRCHGGRRGLRNLERLRLGLNDFRVNCRRFRWGLRVEQFTLSWCLNLCKAGGPQLGASFADEDRRSGHCGGQQDTANYNPEDPIHPDSLPGRLVGPATVASGLSRPRR